MNKKIGIATASLIALSAMTIGGAIPAVAQSSPAADQDDKKDKQDRASNAHHGKKHGHSSAHGINSLGSTLGSTKKESSSAKFGAAHPPIKLEKLKQSLAVRGTHKIGLVPSATGPVTPGINFALIGRDAPNGQSPYFSTKADRFITNSVVAQLYRAGLILPDGSVAKGAESIITVGRPSATPQVPRYSRPPTQQNNFTPPTPILGTPAPIDFAGLAAANPTGVSSFYSVQGSRYLSNKDALQLHQAGLISANGTFAPSIAGDLENRGPNYFQAPTPPNLGIAQTPPTPNVSAPVPPQLTNNETPPLPVVQAPTPPELGIAQTPPTPNINAPVPPQLTNNQTPPFPNITAPVPPNLGGNQIPTATKFRHPPTAQNNFTPLTPILGTPAPIDFAGLAAANPTGASIFYSVQGSKYLSNKGALQLHEVGLISTNGTLAPSLAGELENHGPNYFQAPTPPALGNAQTPQSPNVSAPVPPQLASNQTPPVPMVQAPTPPNFGISQTPPTPDITAPVPPNLGGNQTPTATKFSRPPSAQNIFVPPTPILGTPAPIDFAGLATTNPTGSSIFYSTLGSKYIDNQTALAMHKAGLISTNGIFAPAIAGNFENRGPNYVQAPTPPTLGNAQTPQSPNVTAPVPPGLDIANLTTNPGGRSTYYSLFTGQFLTNVDVLKLYETGLILANGSLTPNVAGRIEYRGPNYVQAPTPPTLGNAQTPQSPNVTAPVPPQLANNQTPPMRGNNAPEPANLGNNQIPIAPVIGTPPGLDIANLTANPGGRSTYYSLPTGQFLTNVEVLKLYETGLILANGSLTPNVAGRIEYRGPNYVQAPTPPALGNNQTPLIQTTHNSLEHGNLLGETEAAIDANQILAQRQVLGHVVVVGIKLPEFEALDE
ncbi:hypothetical protein GCM10009096_21350 [Parasphingorhabdus litoris]|uniref:Uncharacterized protein n=1 Tax=Parasphingorhabdus litoris TaxID=394733 RepID=A0ABN1AKW0_9SPHN